MSKKTITLTEKDATEIADTILNNVSVEVEVDVDDQELRDKWEETEVFDVIENFIDGLDYQVEPNEIELAYEYETNILKKELVGMEVEIEEAEEAEMIKKTLDEWEKVALCFADLIDTMRATGNYDDESIKDIVKRLRDTYVASMETGRKYIAA